MHRKSYEYKNCDSGIFGAVKRPLISLDIRSVNGEWFHLRDVLADTGADISIFPRDIGELVCDDITTGKRIELRGIVPHARLIAFIHEIAFKLNGKEFVAPVAIAESNDVVPLIGRTKGLDCFDVAFSKGRRTIFMFNE